MNSTHLQPAIPASHSMKTALNKLALYQQKIAASAKGFPQVQNRSSHYMQPGLNR
jgi:hypothetical protein